MNTLPDGTLLRGMAERAFGLGFEDGKTRSTPRTAVALMSELRLAYLHSSENTRWLRIHRIKLRQVYGAGFDISKIQFHCMKESRR